MDIEYLSKIWPSKPQRKIKQKLQELYIYSRLNMNRKIMKGMKTITAAYEAAER